MKGHIIMADGTRNRRSKEELVASYDEKITKINSDIQDLEAKMTVAVNDFKAKIDKKKELIAKFEAKKAAALAPRTRQKNPMTAVLEKAKESGLTAEEIAEKLGISL